jgi:putative ABC transport system permease protein
MSLASAVRNVLMHVDRDVPPYRVRSAEEVLALSLAERRFSTALITAFALIALLLAAIGLYGVVSYSVSQSTREIGIRMALGAKARDVFMVALRQGLTPSLLGLGVGVAISLGLMRLMTRLLYEVHPLDWGMFALASAVLVMVSILACLVPARRAAQVDPLTALRHE